MFVLDNKYLTPKNKTELTKLTQTDILEIKILMKKDAVKEYGKLGKNGAIIIKTNK